jgi:hypothetical protein
MPVHATGRYFRNTILEVLKSDFGIVAYSESFGIEVFDITGRLETDGGGGPFLGTRR